MFKDSKIPSNFDKIADFGDNYVVFVKQDILTNDSDYEAYIQYFKPSFYVLHTYDYRITQGDAISFDYNYVNNGYGGQYIDSATYNMQKHTLMYESGDFDTNEYSRADFCDWFPCQLLVVIVWLWFFKQLSRLFFKGGLC